MLLVSKMFFLEPNEAWSVIYHDIRRFCKKDVQKEYKNIATGTVVSNRRHR